MIHPRERENALLLGIDTCGVAGSVALARVQDGRMIVLGESSLASRECAAGLVPAIAGLLRQSNCTMGMLDGVVVVHGPGSFTGIRVGVATAKGLVKARALPLLAISRLAILAAAGGTDCAALDAWRGQIFVGQRTADGWQERLVTAGEFRVAENSLLLPERVAVCEESVAQLLEALAEESRVVRVAAPGAVQALEFTQQRWLAGEWDDASALDGHYLRGTERGTESELNRGMEARAATARNAE